VLTDSSIPNRFLAALPADVLERLRPHLHRIDLPLRHILFEMDEPVGQIVFPDAGMTSLMIRLEDGAQLEIGVVGREGLVGLSALFGAEVSPHTAMVQLPGRGLRIDPRILREEMLRSPALLERVHRYSQAVNAQVSQTAACNIHHNLSERLGRWLLMAHDRADGDVLPLTQEFLSIMLGVRRSGVTVAANTLQQTGAIAHDRGRITVLSRERLEGAACECYAMAQTHSRRLLG